jgi:hypothetical protein
MCTKGIEYHNERNSCKDCDNRVANLMLKHKDLCNSEQFRYLVMNWYLVNGNNVITDIIGDTYEVFWVGNIDGMAYKLLKELRGS